MKSTRKLLQVLPGYFLGLITVLIFSSILPAQTKDAADPKLAKQIEIAQRYESGGGYREAVDAFEKANKMAGGACVPCLEHIADLYYRMNDDKQTLKTSAQLEHIAEAPAEKASAAMLEGEALLRIGTSRHKPELLKNADARFQQALALDPNRSQALYMDGVALGRMGQDSAAVVMLGKYVASDSADPVLSARALIYIRRPELMRKQMVPPFSIKTSDGQQVSLDDLRGKVVLLDFWATWCGPCILELPRVRKIVEQYRGQPLAVISISSDRDRAKWTRYIEENGMNWPQYLDQRWKMTSIFHVNSIPRYFLIDIDGVLEPPNLGSGSNLEGQLKKLVTEAQRNPPQM